MVERADQRSPQGLKAGLRDEDVKRPIRKINMMTWTPDYERVLNVIAPKPADDNWAGSQK